MLSLSSLAVNLPAKKLNIGSDHEALGIGRLESRVFQRLYGFESCPVSEQSEPDLLCAAVEQLLKSTHTDPREIGCVLHAHTGPNIGPHGDQLLHQLKHRLGLAHARCFGTQLNKCVSVVTAFDLMSHLLISGQQKGIIVIGEVADSRELRVLDSAVVGDVGLAVLVDTEGQENRILAQAIDVHDQYAMGIWMDGASQLSRDYDNSYQHNLVAVINRVLKEASIDLSDIKLILPHNVNIQIWKKAIPVLGVAEERVYLHNIAKFAHCFGADILMNYQSAIHEGRLQRGDLCLMVTVGVGGVFGACVIRH